VHLPSVDEHAVHPTGDVRLDVLLVVIKQPMLTHFPLVSLKRLYLQMVLLLAFEFFLNYLIISYFPLVIFVQQELYRGKQAPQKTNRRFYPSRGTIRSHIYKSVIKERYSKIDQEDLQKKVELWKAGSPDDNFEFHPYATYSEEEKRPENGDEENGTDSEQED